MKKIKLIFIISIVGILIGIACLYVSKFVYINYRDQRTAFILGIVDLVVGVSGLVLSKNSKYRREVILAETDERDISIKHKSGYIAGIFLYSFNVLFTVLLYEIDFRNIASIPTWIILCPMFMNLLYLILYLVFFYSMRNKK